MEQKWLIIEDNAFDAELIQRELSKAFPDSILHCTVDFEEALDHLAEDEVQLIISDYNLPGINGLEGCKQLIDSGINIPMVLMTGDGSETTAVSALKSGIDDYIVKDALGGYLPLLTTVIAEVLDRHAVRRERALAQQALTNFTRELELKNRELDAFAQTVAHDLHNPLSMIGTYLDLLKDDLTEDGRQEVPLFLEKAIKMTGKSVEIVDELLKFAQSKHEEVRLEPISIEQTIQGALARLRLKIETQGAIIRLDEDWPDCIGHAPWVEEVWANLISNALKYGGTPPTIEIYADKSLNEQSRVATLCVKDNGPGLTAEQREIVFNPFLRLQKHKAMGISGTGLGLSIVSRIVQRLGGETGVRSGMKEGSTFFFTLPFAQD